MKPRTPGGSLPPLKTLDGVHEAARNGDAPTRDEPDGSNGDGAGGTDADTDAATSKPAAQGEPADTVVTPAQVGSKAGTGAGTTPAAATAALETPPLPSAATPVPEPSPTSAPTPTALPTASPSLLDRVPGDNNLWTYGITIPPQATAQDVMYRVAMATAAATTGIPPHGLRPKALRVAQEDMSCVRVRNHRLTVLAADSIAHRPGKTGEALFVYQQPGSVTSIYGHPPPVKPEPPTATGREFRYVCCSCLCMLMTLSHPHTHTHMCSDFRVGDRVDAKDENGDWFPSTVVAVDKEKGIVRV